MKKTSKPSKPLTRFYVRIRSRHPSHRVLRKTVLVSRRNVIFRLGSTTKLESTPSIEINSIKAIQTSSNKRLMKQAFMSKGVSTAQWFEFSKKGYVIDQATKQSLAFSDLPYPLVTKNIFGSRNKGNKFINSQQELETFIANHSSSLGNYIIERFYNFSREYRLHVTKDGCFYTCRKMLKSDTPDANKWHRHNDNCVWYIESNPKFDKPVNWKEIEEHCINALLGVGLDVGACDVKVQSATDENGKIRKRCAFIIIEINSAPSFGEGTAEQYKKILPKIVNNKL